MDNLGEIRWVHLGRYKRLTSESTGPELLTPLILAAARARSRSPVTTSPCFRAASSDC